MGLIYQLSFILFFALPSHAQDMSQDTFEFIQGLRNSGIEDVGSLNLRKFQNELGQIQWQITDSPLPGPVSVKPGILIETDDLGNLVLKPTTVPIPEIERPNRMSGRYEFQNVTIHEEELKKHKDQDVYTQFLLHEALGALGYNDYNYALSTSLMMIQSLPETTKSLGDAFFNTKSLENGGSSVGGGGDTTSLEIKSIVLKSIQKNPVSLDFLANYAGITFEPLDEEENQSVMIFYKVHIKKGLLRKSIFRGVRQDRRYEELVTLFYPRAIWNKSPEVREEIISFIRYGILSLYPANSNTPMVNIGPISECEDKPLWIPKDRSTGADLVHRFRALMLSKCMKHKKNVGFGIQNEVGFEVDMPRRK